MGAVRGLLWLQVGGTQATCWPLLLLLLLLRLVAGEYWPAWGLLRAGLGMRLHAGGHCQSRAGCCVGALLLCRPLRLHLLRHRLLRLQGLLRVACLLCVLQRRPLMLVWHVRLTKDRASWLVQPRKLLLLWGLPRKPRVLLLLWRLLLQRGLLLCKQLHMRVTLCLRCEVWWRHSHWVRTRLLLLLRLVLAAATEHLPGQLRLLRHAGRLLRRLMPRGGSGGNGSRPEQRRWALVASL